MNSNKQKNKFLKAKRKQRAEKLQNIKLDYLGHGRIKADSSKLTHVNSYGGLVDYLTIMNEDILNAEIV